jgi:hypothetical protein
LNFPWINPWKVVFLLKWIVSIKLSLGETNEASGRAGVTYLSSSNSWSGLSERFVESVYKLVHGESTFWIYFSAKLDAGGLLNARSLSSLPLVEWMSHGPPPCLWSMRDTGFAFLFQL